jgi:hypothetical protein
MTPRKGKVFAQSVQAAAAMQLLSPHAAGIDVHASQHYVAVPIVSVPVGFVNPDRNLPANVRVFGTTTGELEALVAWLKDCFITTVALEAPASMGTCCWTCSSSKGSKR